MVYKFNFRCIFVVITSVLIKLDVMKDLLTLNKAITQEVEDILNKQITMEAQASASYLAMAAWCMRNGYDEAYEFFSTQSDEERDHQKKLFRFVNNMGGKATAGVVGATREDFDSLRAVFEFMLEQEIAVTQAIDRIVDLAYKCKDHSTAEFMRWFVEEQREETFVARRILQVFDRMIQDGLTPFEAEQEVVKISYKE